MEKKAEKGIARAVGMEMQGVAAVLLPALGKVSWREGLKCSAEELPPRRIPRHGPNSGSVTLGVLRRANTVFPKHTVYVVGAA